MKLTTKIQVLLDRRDKLMEEYIEACKVKISDGATFGGTAFLFEESVPDAANLIAAKIDILERCMSDVSKIIDQTFKTIE